MAIAVMLVNMLAGGPPGVEARSGAATPGAGRATIGPFALAVAVDATTGHAFVASADLDNRNGGPTGQGHIGMLDTRTGRLLRTVTAGLGSIAVEVDEGAGRALVANEGRVQ